MPDMKMVEVRPEQVDELAALAKPIWTDHFTPIIGAEQTAYMIEKFQSAPAMRAQMEHDGYHYYFFLYDGQKAGYTGIRRDGDSLFLSKIYVEKSFRRRGLASLGIAFMEDLCRREGLRKIWLTVNKNNDGSIACYRARGFVTAYPLVTDIGNGFVMDDYVMEKWISPRTLLYVDTCLRPHSRTRELADAFLKAYQKAHPKDTLDIIRLAEADIHCVRGEELEHREALKRAGKVDAPEFAEARRFAAADGIVIAAPMWELSFPAMLKAYIETVSVPGVTFRYGEGDTGCAGCCKASRLLYLTTRGGIYTKAAASLELGEKELKALSQFFGIPGFDCLFVEGTDLLPKEEVAARMDQAKSMAAQLAKAW